MVPLWEVVMLQNTVNSAGLISVGGIWGGMLFFVAVFAPLVFMKLEPEVAGRFIRQVFPVYYASMGVTSGVAAAALALGSTHTVADAAVMALVCAGFWLARQALVPTINRYRDASLAGDPGAGRRFHRLHRLSVLINGIQLVAVAVVLLRFVWG